MSNKSSKKLQAKDYKSDQEIRWCPGCGDFSILSAVQRALADLDIPKEDYVFVSGIGCSSRFPYYMSTYGFHGIHGRAGALATGIKIANPKLNVWQITGDGDALAIGGNHFIHEIRRNVDITVLLFNNKIYGLTKGQYSPTSLQGHKTKTSPMGVAERPFNCGSLVLGAQGTFFARTIDINVKESVEVYKFAAKFKGTAVIEALQNCVIFNDKAHEEITGKDVREESQLWLEHGKPMIFGKNKDKGLIFDSNKLKVVKIGEDGITKDDILVHNTEEEDDTMHNALIKMSLPEFPYAFGIIRAVKKPTFEQQIHQQIKDAQDKRKCKSTDELIQSGSTWEVQ